MKFVVLIYTDNKLLDALPAGEFESRMRGCLAHADELRRQGKLLDSQMLGAPAAAKSVRVRGGKQTTVDSYRLTKRGGIGVINMKTTDKTGKVVAAFPVEEDSEIMIITQQAKLIRLGVANIRETGRSAQGVTLIKCGDEDLVTSATLLAAEDDD